MLTPAYTIVIGRARVDTRDEPQASTLTELTVTRDLAIPADAALLTLSYGGLAPEVGEDAHIELGFKEDDEDPIRVLTGTVVSLERGLQTMRVAIHTAAAKLLNHYADKTYEDQRGGAIVRDLAGQAGVTVATADNGIHFPAYVIDGRRAFFHHMRNLADLCGFDLYFDTENKLVFEKFNQGKRVHTLEYAKHLVAFEAGRVPPAFSAVEAWGESPGGAQAKEAWAWLTKDFGGLKGTSGQGDPTRLLERPALRTGDAAQTAAEAAHTEYRRLSVRGCLQLLGQPGIKLGDAVRMQGLPDPHGNETYQVRRLTHRIDKRGGFTTRVGFRAIDVSQTPVNPGLPVP